MASYQGHLMTSSVLGAAYGSVGVLGLDLNWGPAFLGAGVTAVGGLLPDLDSDSGVPVREMFNLAAALTPLLLIERFRALKFTGEETLVLLVAVYLIIRYGLSYVFKRWTVHRGMFHSIPAMLIAGLSVYLLYHSPEERIRWFVAIGVMLGFLSHLVLDELCSVDFMGARIKLNKFAGSAVKLWSKSAPATIFTYLILVVLAWAVWEDNAQRRGNSTILTRPSTMLPVEAREPALVFLPAQLGPDMTRPGGRNRSTSAHRRTNTFL